MMHIVPNTKKVYMAPHNYEDSFILDSHRFYLSGDLALKSDYGKYGMVPPLGRGFYSKISKKEFKEAKALYIEKQSKFLKALNSGYLKAGGVQSSFDF